MFIKLVSTLVVTIAVVAGGAAYAGGGWGNDHGQGWGNDHGQGWGFGFDKHPYDRGVHGGWGHGGDSC